MITDRGLAYALGASLCAHALVLGLGGGLRKPDVQAPRLLEARLVQDALPAKPPEPAKAHPPVPQPQPVERVPSHKVAAAHSEPVAPQHRLTTEAVADRPAPAIASAPVSAPAPAIHAVAPVAPAPAAAAPPAPSYTPPVFGAAYLDNPKPGYPMIARRRGLEGTVRLDVRVSAEGIPIDVKVRESAGHEALDEAAVTAVWHWKFKPARRGGEPVEASVMVPIRFRLGGDDAS